MMKHLWLVFGYIGLLTGCDFTGDTDLSPQPAAAPTSTSGTFLIQDQAVVMTGICFEAAADAAGQVFVLRNAEDHIRFYELADNSQLCRNPVERKPFDFDGGRVLAGLWSTGIGCTADHEIRTMTRDESVQHITLELTFSIVGDCDYELVRPFWIALDNAAEYAIEIVVDN